MNILAKTFVRISEENLYLLLRTNGITICPGDIFVQMTTGNIIYTE